MRCASVIRVGFQPVEPLDTGKEGDRDETRLQRRELFAELESPVQIHEDISDGRGYTAGIIGFCSGTGDMLQLVTAYTKSKPKNPLAKYLPALKKVDGLGVLGQFIYYDAIVVHGNGTDPESFGSIRANAMKKAKTPAQGSDQVAYLNAYLDARVVAMKAEEAHEDVSRVEDAQRVFLRAGNLDLTPPLKWKTYGDSYIIK